MAPKLPSESFSRLWNYNLTWWAFLLLWNIGLSTSFCPPLCTCNDNSLSVDCQEAGNLRMVPIFLNPRTKFLSLANNQIQEISMSFQFYSQLQFLDFSRNKIRSIGVNNFENLRNVRKLNASFNGIQELEKDVFLGLNQTYVLDLSANQLERISGPVFSPLTSLRELYLDRNRLDALDWTLFRGLESLETLSAKYNFLRVIQPPATLPAVVPVEALVFKPSAPTPPTTWTLNNLKKLDLSWNQLTRIKDNGLGVFSALLDLNLAANYIHTLEEGAFYPSGSLTKLNLSQNRLTRIPTLSLEKLGSSLEELDLSGNRLVDRVEAHSFRSLFRLRVLRLSDNPSLSAIDADAFLDNVNLAEFEGDHLSNLTELAVGLFNNKPFLKSFYLRWAQVTVLPKELLENPQYAGLVGTLRLVGNPLDCNCTSLPLFQYISRNPGTTTTTTMSMSPLSVNKSGQLLEDSWDPNTSSLGHVQCASPPHLQGALLQDLRLQDFQHCFDPVFFAQEHFEILVIGIGALIVVSVVTVVAVRLCCMREVCSKRCGNIRCCCCCQGKDEKDKALDDFCCNGNGVGTLRRERAEYPTIVPAKKGVNVSSDEFRAVQTLSRGRNNIGHVGGFGGALLYSNGSPASLSHSNNSNSTSTTGHTPLTLTTTTTTNGSGSPASLDLDAYLRNNTLKSNNGRLRFDPKMQMHHPEDMGIYQHPNHATMMHTTSRNHPPMILHYEYDYPDYRSMHRVKQVPSVLV